jgi:segregation and condensation protein B
VNSSGVIRTLQDRNLIDIVGRGEGLGRPLLYGTTQRFEEHFGFTSLDDLPRPDELPIILKDRIPLQEIEEESPDTSDFPENVPDEESDDAISEPSFDSTV